MIWISMLPLVMLTVYQGVISVAQVRQSEDEAGSRLVRQVAEAVEQSLRSRIATMIVLARSPTLEGDAHLDEFYRLAQGFQRTHDSELILADEQGHMLLHTGRAFGSTLPPLPRPKGRAAVPLALATGQPAVGDSFIGPIAQARLVAVAVPVPASGPGQRVLLTVVSARRLQELLDRAPIREGWSLSVIDAQHQVIARIPPQPLAERQGATRLVQDLSLAPWTIELEVSPANRWAPVRHAALIVGLSIVTATLAGVLAGTWAGRRLAAGVAALADSPPQPPPPQPSRTPAIAEIAAAQAMLDASTRAREEATDAMRRSEATFRAMFDGLFDAVVLAGPDRVIRLVNPAFTAMFGYTADEAVGRTTDFLYVDEADYAATGLERFSPVAAAAPPLYLQRYRRRDGSEFRAESVGLRVMSAEGQLLGFLGLHRDITRREQEEDRLRLSEELFAAAFANNPAAIALTRLHDGVMLNVNERWLAMTGESRASIIGQSARFMWPKREEAARFVANLLEHRTLRGWEQTFFKRNGEPFDAEISSQVLDMNGEPVILSTLIDISARKRAEGELRELAATLERRVDQRTAELAAARDEAQAANRAKSAFLANMSHEIRSPMNAIIGLAHLAARDVQDPIQSARLAKIGDAAAHLLQIINDILDLSKIEADKMVLEDVEFALDDMLSHAFQMVAERAREKGLELVLDAGRLPSQLRGDPTRLKQLLLNLLNNAVKFTERGWVRMKCSSLREEGGRQLLRFEVQDTGPGMTAEEQTRIFNAFEQADSSVTRRHGGTGLGLALCRHLVALMGGEIGVNSAPGAGSRFWFTAWFGRAQGLRESAAPVSLTGLRALLVDDLPESLDVLVDGLTRWGLSVDAMTDGESALRQVAAESAASRAYDIVLLDWRMGPPDGIETLGRLRGMLGRRMPPAILMTAFDDPSMWRQVQESGFDACLVKPITASRLHDALMNVLGCQSVVTVKAPGREGEAELSRLEPHRGQRVLLVEDIPVNREVACDLLSHAGLVVETAENGAVAVEMALSRPYDLILMDVQMPVLDGLSASREIRARAGSATPIVAMTANAFGEDRAACLAAGMNDHLAKPVSAEKLYSTLLRWLARPADHAPAGRSATVPDRNAWLTQRLSCVESFDYAEVLDNLGGQVPTLERTLLSFIETYRHSEHRFEQLVRDGDIARCREACHALYGHYPILGSPELQTRLGALQRALRHDADALERARLARSVDEALSALVARLEAAIAA